MKYIILVAAANYAAVAAHLPDGDFTYAAKNI